MGIAVSLTADRLASSWTVSEATAAPAEILVRGSIVDSWVEPAGSCDWGSRLVIQVAPRDRPRELLILEAEATLVPDLGWLEDLGENLCHGSPVSAQVRPSRGGKLRATRIELTR